MSAPVVYVSRDGQHRVMVDESDRMEINSYRAMGFRPAARSAPQQAPAEPAAEPEPAPEPAPKSTTKKKGSTKR